MQELSQEALRQINWALNAPGLNADEDSILLTKSEVAELLKFINEQDEAIYSGEVAPQDLRFRSKLQSFIKSED